MTTRELILAEIGRIPDERLDELYGLIRTFAASAISAHGDGIMARLSQIQIDAPPDFAANLDLYLSREKHN